MAVQDGSGRGLLRGLAWLCIYATFLLGAPRALAVASIEGPLTTVRVENGDSIRDIAARYLKDPNLWPQIVELSGLGSVVAVRPGVELKVPVIQVAAADEALATALASIQRATAEGARIFAPVEIGMAIDRRETAVEYRTEGQWGEVVVHAEEATGYADQALEISLKQRDRAAEAVLSDIHGSVEGRTPKEASWSGRALNDILIEFERVRTLSGSTAQVTFRDLSRLRLNPHSNAVIQRMRSDPLTGVEKTKVSLVEGDFYALLNQLHHRADFEVEVPGVETEVHSADFWVSHDSEASRFTNYDEAQIRVSARGQTIGLGKNEGAFVPANDDPLVEVDVLARPRLLVPRDREQIFNGRVNLHWRGPESAAGFWLEIAGDVDFNTMKISEWGLTDSRKEVDKLEPGNYFWRISALDEFGLPGERSLVRTFTSVADATPPYLTVRKPAEDAIIRTSEVIVSGETEIDATLTVDRKPVPLNETGRFEAHIQALPGVNKLQVEAVDRAGNRTSRVRRFVFREDRKAEISFDPTIPADGTRRLLTRGEELGVSGSSTAEPGSRLVVRDVHGLMVADTLIEKDGRFGFAVPASERGAVYTARIISVSGITEGETSFVAVRDPKPPILSFDFPPPPAISIRWLQLTGSAVDAAELAVNGTNLPITDNRFETLVSLDPGLNPIEFVATDRVGNVTVQKLDVLLDMDPPTIGRTDIIRTDNSGDAVGIEVAATDPAGLKQAAQYTIALGNEERNGFLRYDPLSGLYRETLPPVSGPLRLVEISVEDYAGNVSVRRFD